MWLGKSVARHQNLMYISPCAPAGPHLRLCGLSSHAAGAQLCSAAVCSHPQSISSIPITSSRGGLQGGPVSGWAEGLASTLWALGRFLRHAECDVKWVLRALLLHVE